MKNTQRISMVAVLASSAASILLAAAPIFLLGGTTVTANPNVGLKRVGSELGKGNTSVNFGGGLEFFTPVRPWNVTPTWKPRYTTRWTGPGPICPRISRETRRYPGRRNTSIHR